MPALEGKDYGKTKMRYSDYTLTPSGLQYKDVKVGLPLNKRTVRAYTHTVHLKGTMNAHVQPITLPACVLDIHMASRV